MATSAYSQTKRLSRLLGVLLVGVLMSGCTTIAIQRDYDESASFDDYQTFSWIAAKNTQDVPGPYRDDGLLDKRIKRAVTNALAYQGYTEQPDGTPDFYVVYRVGLEEKGYSYGFGYPYGYGFGYGGYGFGHHSGFHRSFFGHGGYGYPYGGYGGYGTTYTEGTLVIDIIDAGTNELVWRGSAVSPMSDETYDAKEINKAVEKILEEFPPPLYPSKSPDSRRVVVAS